jgi:hypothetical protein
MFRRPPCVAPSVVLIPLLLLMATALPAEARGGPIALATEVMMEDQAANNLIIQALFGSAPGASLTYLSTVSSDGRSFSDETAPRQGYLGQAISDSIQGEFLGPREVGTWTTKATGTRGGAVMWTVQDMHTVSQLPGQGGFSIQSDYDYFDKDGIKIGDLHTSATIDKDETRDFGGGFFTNRNGSIIPGSSFRTESWLRSNGEWVYGGHPPSPPFALMPNGILSIGFSPPAGGDGTFTTHFVPEPSSWGLLALGSLGLLRAHWRRQPASS